MALPFWWVDDDDRKNGQSFKVAYYHYVTLEYQAYTCLNWHRHLTVAHSMIRHVGDIEVLKAAFLVLRWPWPMGLFHLLMPSPRHQPPFPPYTLFGLTLFGPIPHLHPTLWSWNAETFLSIPGAMLWLHIYNQSIILKFSLSLITYLGLILQIWF